MLRGHSDAGRLRRRLDLSLCESLYPSNSAARRPTTATTTPPRSSGGVVPYGQLVDRGAGIHPPGSTLPAEFDGALFFADYTRNCIWVMERGSGPCAADAIQDQDVPRGGRGPGQPRVRPGQRPLLPQLLDRHDQADPLHRGQSAAASAGRALTRPAAALPLTVSFAANGSSDPDPGDTLTYDWDLDGDGEFDDGTGTEAEFTYTTAGNYLATLRATDNHGASATDSIAIAAGNTPPVATITTPSTGRTGRWATQSASPAARSMTRTGAWERRSSAGRWHSSIAPQTATSTRSRPSQA